MVDRIFCNGGGLGQQESDPGIIWLQLCVRYLPKTDKSFIKVSLELHLVPAVDVVFVVNHPFVCVVNGVTVGCLLKEE